MTGKEGAPSLQSPLICLAFVLELSSDTKAWPLGLPR